MGESVTQSEVPNFACLECGLTSGLMADKLYQKTKEGERRATTLMAKVVKGEKIDGKRLWFGEDLIAAVHKRAMFFYPGWAGVYRDTDDKFIGDFRPEWTRNIPCKMYSLGRWLEDEVNTYIHGVQSPRLEDALRISSAIYFALTYLLQPFQDGNKRAARIVSNGVLILGTDEFRARQSLVIPSSAALNGIIVEPIEKLSNQDTIDELRRRLNKGKVVKADAYGRSLEAVQSTGLLNPLELHLANMWKDSLARRLDANYDVRDSRSKINRDAKLMSTFRRRLELLEKFQIAHETGSAVLHPIPNFFNLSRGRIA